MMASLPVRLTPIPLKSLAVTSLRLEDPHDLGEERALIIREHQYGIRMIVIFQDQENGHSPNGHGPELYHQSGCI